jgi:hypothetical protein
MDGPIIYAENQLARRRRVLAAPPPIAADALVEDSRTGLRLAPKEYEKHLDAVLEVGHQALAELRAQFERDDEHRALSAKVAERQKMNAARVAIYDDGTIPGRARVEKADKLSMPGSFEEDRRALAAREQAIIRETLGSARDFGGATHTQATPLDAGVRPGTFGISDARLATADWRARLSAGEALYPTDWLRTSAAQPLTVASSDRAFYSEGRNLIAFPTHNRDPLYQGGFPDDSAETVAHELGHRMEQQIPGLKELEFTLMRRRSRDATGRLLGARQMDGYQKGEKAYPDKWLRDYAGKTYEDDMGGPLTASWEVFQVGMQDTFGRDARGRYDGGDELQAFVLGALLTLKGS